LLAFLAAAKGKFLPCHDVLLDVELFIGRVAFREVWAIRIALLQTRDSVLLLEGALNVTLYIIAINANLLAHCRQELQIFFDCRDVLE